MAAIILCIVPGSVFLPEKNDGGVNRGLRGFARMEEVARMIGFSCGSYHLSEIIGLVAAVARSAKTTMAVGDEERGTHGSPKTRMRCVAAPHDVRPPALWRRYAALRTLPRSVGSSQTRHPRLLLFWRYAPPCPIISERWNHPMGEPCENADCAQCLIIRVNPHHPRFPFTFSVSPHHHEDDRAEHQRRAEQPPAERAPAESLLRI